MSRQLVKARELGAIDGNQIEDRTRGFLGGDGYWLDPEKFRDYIRKYFLEYWKEYKRKLWDDQDNFVIIWVEKDALSRVIAQASDEYRIIVAPSRGYASYTYINEALSKLPEDKKIIVLHFADHDPSGLDMTRDLQRRLTRYSVMQHSGSQTLLVRRMALTFTQVDKYGLAPNPTKSTDTRASGYIKDYGHSCWELDAIEPRELQRLVVESIEQRLDLKQWKKSVKREEKERKQLEEIFNDWKEKIGEDEEED